MELVATEQPSPLAPVEAAAANWFQSFVLHTAGQVPANLSPREAVRYQIAAVEHAMSASIEAGETVDNVSTYPIRHIFAPGSYVRVRSD